MMKMSCKKAGVFALVAALTGMSFVPAFAWAEDSSSSDTLGEKRQQMLETRKKNMDDRREALAEKKEAMMENRKEASCERIVSMSEKVSGKFSSLGGKIAEHREEKAKLFESRRDTREAALNDKRENQDERRATMYAKMMEKATTDKQKEAVEQFQKTVDQAVSDRRAAVDKAIDAFHDGVDALLQSRKTSVTDTRSDFKEAVEAAFEKAKSDCSSGTDPKTVRENLTASLKAAREKLNTDRQSFEKIGTEVPALAETRRAAVRKALDDFKATVEKARADLKVALEA